MFSSRTVISIFVFVVLFVILKVPLEAADWKFQEIVVDSEPPQPSRITDCAIVDIDRDGKPDLWYSARKGNRKDEEHFMPWYKNTGDLNNWTRNLPFEGPSCYGTWGDVDGDGDMDLIASKDRKRELLWMENPLIGGSGKPEEGPWKIWRIERAGSGDLDPDEVYTFYRGADNHVHHGLDLNSDGHPDIINCTYSKAAYYIPGPGNPKTPNGGWKCYEIGDAGGTGSLGDIDGDGDVDFATRSGWYENPGDPTQVPWPKHSYQTKGPGGKVEIGDIDGDGRLDVAVSSEEHTDGITWFHNPGSDATGTWTARHVIAPNSGWKGLHSLQLSDFDGDGDLDIFTAEMHDRQQQRVAICENLDGKGRSWSVHVLSNCGCHNAKVADIDGDGDPDIIGKNYSADKRPRIWINQISLKVDLDGDLGGIRSLSDFDSDDDPDIISVGWTHNKVMLYENKAVD